MARVSIILEAMADLVSGVDAAAQRIPELMEMLERDMRAVDVNVDTLRPWLWDGERTARLRERGRDLRDRYAMAQEVARMRSSFHPSGSVVYNDVVVAKDGGAAEFAAMVKQVKDSRLNGKVDVEVFWSFVRMLNDFGDNAVFVKTLTGAFTTDEMKQFVTSLDKVGREVVVDHESGLWPGFTDRPGEGLPSDMTLVPVDPGILATDPMDAGRNRQRGVGDCWLVATVNGLMESAQGDQFLQQNIRWDPVRQGYWVTLYEDGSGTEYLVTEVIDEGARADGKQGIVSLYEAAVYQAHGWSGLQGNMPWDGPSIIAGEDAHTYIGRLIQISDNTAETGGSTDGEVTLVATSPRLAGLFSDGYAHYPADVTDASGNPVKIKVPDNHVMEVVEILPDGRIGIRNPWGFWERADGSTSSVYGVVYMTPTEFDWIFLAMTSTKEVWPI